MTDSGRWVVIKGDSIVFGPDTRSAAVDRAQQLADRDRAEWREHYGNWREPPRMSYSVGEVEW